MRQRESKGRIDMILLKIDRLESQLAKIAITLECLILDKDSDYSVESSFNTSNDGMEHDVLNDDRENDIVDEDIIVVGDRVRIDHTERNLKYEGECGVVTRVTKHSVWIRLEGYLEPILKRKSKVKKVLT